VTVEVEDVSYL